MSDRLLTTREVAERVGLSTATILRRHQAGELTGIYLASNQLRFRESDFEAWLEWLAAGRPQADRASVRPRGKRLVEAGTEV